MSEENIRVVCRFRPTNERERSEMEGKAGALQLTFPTPQSVAVNLRGAAHAFSFDAVMPPSTEQAYSLHRSFLFSLYISFLIINKWIIIVFHFFNLKFSFSLSFLSFSFQKFVYDVTAKATVDEIFKGFNGTVFVYGQTGCDNENGIFANFLFRFWKDIHDDGTRRLIVWQRIQGNHPACCRGSDFNILWWNMTLYFSNCFLLFLGRPTLILSTKSSALTWKFTWSKWQTWSDQKPRTSRYKTLWRALYISLTKFTQIREAPNRGVWIENLSFEYVTNEKDVYNLIELGGSNRKVASTQMNKVYSFIKYTSWSSF